MNKMTDEELALERGKMLHLVSKALVEAGWSSAMTTGPDSVTLELTHPALPDWSKLLIIEKKKSDRRFRLFDVNQMRLAGSYVSEQMTPQSVKRLMAKLETIKQTVMGIRQRNAEMQAADAKYAAQKEEELAGIKVPDWVDPVIRTTGDFAGLYRVDFAPGSLIERLTAEQVIRLVSVLNEFETTAEAEDANRSI